MRMRLRARSDVDYQVARSNEMWPDHVLRTLTTAAHIAWLKPPKVIDPACGDGSIVLAAHRLQPIEHAMFGDIGRANILSVKRMSPVGWVTEVGDVVDLLRAQPIASFDVVVLTEILEHLEDPVAVAREARRVGRNLIASSPEMRPGQTDSNPEHLWMFDGDGYREMLIEAGWVPSQKTFLGFPASMYDFQVWVCD